MHPCDTVRLHSVVPGNNSIGGPSIYFNPECCKKKRNNYSFHTNFKDKRGRPCACNSISHVNIFSHSPRLQASVMRTSEPENQTNILISVFQDTTGLLDDRINNFLALDQGSQHAEAVLSGTCASVLWLVVASVRVALPALSCVVTTTLWGTRGETFNPARIW